MTKALFTFYAFCLHLYCAYLIMIPSLSVCFQVFGHMLILHEQLKRKLWWDHGLYGILSQMGRTMTSYNYAVPCARVHIHRALSA